MNVFKRFWAWVKRKETNGDPETGLTPESLDDGKEPLHWTQADRDNYRDYLQDEHGHTRF